MAAACWPAARAAAALMLTLDLAGPRPDRHGAVQAALESAASAPRGDRRMLRLDASGRVVGAAGGLLTLAPVLVASLDHDPGMAARLDALAVLAHDLGLSVPAQGVTTQAQRPRLRRLGCDLIEGPLARAPCPAGEFEAYLTET